MSLDTYVVNASISLGASLITRAGLGTPLIAGAATFSDRVQSYAADDDYANDSDLSTELKAALARIFAQTIHVSTVKVGRVGADQKLDINLAPENPVVDGKIYGLKINGTNYEYTADVAGAGDTTADVVDELVTAITGGGEPVTMTDNGNDFDIEADVAGVPFTYADGDNVDGTQTTTVTTADRSISTELSEIEAEDGDWYYLLTTSRDETDINRAADWIASDGQRIYIAQTDDSGVKGSGSSDIASVLKADNNGRVGVIFHGTDTEYLAEGLTGFKAAADPDQQSTTWAFANVVGVSADTLTTSERAYILGKYASVYESAGGVAVTFEGKLASGKYIDQRISADWLATRIKEDCLQELLNYSARNEKIPYTDNGFAVFTALVMKRLQQGIRAGHFVDGSDNEDELPWVTMPSLDPDSDNPVTTEDREARILRFSCGATLAGGVHRVVVNAYVETS